ncbi:unnamed protein product [Darwinula stevensoni]|uniref:Caveolin n=1 Tax=Darwinula stevensoni TaxID=69355 RepID=A0A7R9ADE9_9CRUS|nr:unnamed protein product [Darwinula stevensoni]CAG0901024.1 unnamed protein product [Darwinula stevensoni]
MDSNSHSEWSIQVSYDDVFAEPDGIRSLDCVWRLSNTCFKGSKNFCYMGLTLFVAPIIALCQGFHFAILSFCHIWCVSACVRSCKINCAVVRNCCEIFCHACISPCYEACGMCLSRVKVKYQKLPDGEAEKDYFAI